MSDSGDRRSPLDAAHRRLGAKMVPFGGWEMPLSYPTGTLAEHLACRHDAVAFDVSHLGTVRVTGPDAFDRLQETLTNDLAKIGPGRAQYTHLLDPADGSVVDDIIVWWLGRGSETGDSETGDSETGEAFDVMPNASNTDRVVAALGDGACDVTAGRAIIAIQGPYARDRLTTIAPEAAAVPRFAVRPFDWRGSGCVAAGTGYTGEDGVEIAVPADAAEDLWQAILDAGIVPAGLGARDTLRLEAALPLHGHELGPGITPLQAGLGWVVAWNKPSGFRGKAALLEEKERGVSRKLAGLSTPGRQPPREGCVVTIDGTPQGTVTSGNFSPVLGHGIALAFLPPDARADATIEIEVRGRPVAATRSALPFVPRGGKGR
jgi:aminomethyltransferase